MFWISKLARGLQTLQPRPASRMFLPSPRLYVTLKGGKYICIHTYLDIHTHICMYMNLHIYSYIYVYITHLQVVLSSTFSTCCYTFVCATSRGANKKSKTTLKETKSPTILVNCFVRPVLIWNSNWNCWGLPAKCGLTESLKWKS